ncbi:hypothetical protein EJB05_40055 [Eragrostis curvula]|uniref:HMA domain-containing protein n=1 Tax=Eragrostis curvula TaxID=38414 RepID=A0A5J9TZ67_9POAL|nr:hypothetical protein EJB05_40055 [Eragrostis curvula]
MAAKKAVLKLDLHDEKDKKRALKAASNHNGIDSLAVDLKDGKMTVIGTVDPVEVVTKLRKQWPSAQIVSIGPWPEKKDDKKGGGEKKDEKKDDKKDAPKQVVWYPPQPAWYAQQHPYNHQYPPQYFIHNHSAEEDPNSCVIC